MIYANLSRLTITMALGLATLAAYSMARPGAEPLAGSITPVAIVIDMKDVQANVQMPFEFTLTNGTPRTWKVAGTPGICKKLGCVWAVDPPAELPPGRAANFRYLCDAKQAGDIRLETAIYLNASPNEGITIPVRFRGIVTTNGLVP